MRRRSTSKGCTLISWPIWLKMFDRILGHRVKNNFSSTSPGRLVFAVGGNGAPFRFLIQTCIYSCQSPQGVKGDEKEEGMRKRSTWYEEEEYSKGCMQLISMPIWLNTFDSEH